MPLDHSKDISAHVSTCNHYNFNALTPVHSKFIPQGQSTKIKIYN